MNAALATLRGQVAADRAVAERRFETALAQAARPESEAELALIALSLHHAQAAIEALLERSVRKLDGDVPTGPDSHRALLQRAALEIPDVRPAIVSRAIVPLLQRLLGFRHFLRHDYGAELDAAQLGELQRLVTQLRPLLAADLDAWDAWLAALAEATPPAPR